MNHKNVAKRPQPYELYRHFKGMIYQILSIAIHSETREEMVVYQALYGDYSIYVRPLDMFVSPVDHEKYPDVSQEYRFERVVLTQENKEVEIAVVPTVEKVETQLDDGILEFLDARTFEEKYRIFMGMKHRLTDHFINTMAVSIDVEVEDGALEERVRSLQNCLQTMVKFECNR
ncbi:MAG: DUF1653 domain-containing protein [Lachnospiraceae bacterium]